MNSDSDLLGRLVAHQPVPAPKATLVWHAIVEIGERESLGHSPLGERWIVPINGGRFWGAAGFTSLHGRIRPGGADRQLLREDGVKQLQAVYEMEATDGAILSVVNEVIVDEQVQSGGRYAMSHIGVTAPEGTYAWMNRRLFVGTLQRLQPKLRAVLIRGYVVELAAPSGTS